MNDGDLLMELAAKGYEPEKFWEGVGRAYWRPDLARSPEHEAQQRAVVDVLLPFEFHSILDVGCGDGRLGELLLSMSPDATYTGLDVSPDALAVVSEKIPGAETHRRVLWDWPLKGRQWDTVICSEVLMHVPFQKFGTAVEMLQAATRRQLVIVDWYPSAKAPPDEIAPWCFYHTPALLSIFGEPARVTGEQGIWLWRPD